MAQFLLDFTENPDPRWPLSDRSPRPSWTKKGWLVWVVLALSLLGWLASLLGFCWFYSENRRLQQLYNAQVLRHDSLMGAHLEAQRRLLLLETQRRPQPRPAPARGRSRSSL